MRSQLDEIRDQQRQTWDKFSAGWNKWDELVLGWLAPVGQELIGSAGLREDSNVLDVAAGTGEPGLTAAALVPKGMVISTDLSERMLQVTLRCAGSGIFRRDIPMPAPFRSRTAHLMPYSAGSGSCSSLMST